MGSILIVGALFKSLVAVVFFAKYSGLYSILAHKII